jgi:hypothetical protein
MSWHTPENCPYDVHGRDMFFGYEQPASCLKSSAMWQEPRSTEIPMGISIMPLSPVFDARGEQGECRKFSSDQSRGSL